VGGREVAIGAVRVFMTRWSAVEMGPPGGGPIAGGRCADAGETRRRLVAQRAAGVVALLIRVGGVADADDVPGELLAVERVGEPVAGRLSGPATANTTTYALSVSTR
jgi:hypothetical protein